MSSIFRSVSFFLSKLSFQKPTSQHRTNTQLALNSVESFTWRTSWHSNKCVTERTRKHHILSMEYPHTHSLLGDVNKIEKVNILLREIVKQEIFQPYLTDTTSHRLKISQSIAWLVSLSFVLREHRKWRLIRELFCSMWAHLPRRKWRLLQTNWRITIGGPTDSCWLNYIFR